MLAVPPSEEGGSRSVVKIFRVCDRNAHGNPLGQWILNPAATFGALAAGTFGNLGRNAYIGPNLAQFDLTLHKRLPITEKVNLEFRAELYNLFNKANFSNPPATLGAGLPAGYNVAVGAEPAASGLQPGQPYTASAAGGAFGRFSSTVANTVGLGAQRQIQLSLRLNF